MNADFVTRMNTDQKEIRKAGNQEGKGTFVDFRIDFFESVFIRVMKSV